MGSLFNFYGKYGREQEKQEKLWIKKSRLIYVSVFVILLSFFTFSAFNISVSADDGSIVMNDKARIDFSGANNTGGVKVNVLSKTDKNFKITVEKGDVKYTYNLKNDTTAEVYPLQLGDGEYTVKVYMNAGATDRYAFALAAKYTVKLTDPLAPFLNPSQYVYFTEKSKITEKAAELVQNCGTEIEKVEKIYNFVISSLAYDTDKANAAASGQLSGYLPSADAVLNSGKGICFDYATVFTAMLRSQGIPAKLVTGYVKPDNLYHAWNEFYLKDKGGWFKINDMKFAAKKFERVDPTFDSTSKSSKKVLEFIGDGSNYSKFLEY